MKNEKGKVKSGRRRLACFVAVHFSFFIFHFVAYGDDWTLFRGTPQADGVATSDLPAAPVLLWKRTFKDAAYESTPAIVGDAVYIGGLDGYFRALNLSDGAERWQFKRELGFKAPAAVRECTMICWSVGPRTSSVVT